MESIAGQPPIHPDTAAVEWGQLSQIVELIPWKRTARARHYRNQVVGTHVGAVAILVPLITLVGISLLWAMVENRSFTSHVLAVLISAGALLAVVFFAGVWVLTLNGTRSRIMIGHLRHTASSSQVVASHLAEGDPPPGAVWVVDIGQGLYVSPRRVIFLDESQDLYLSIPSTAVTGIEALPLETMWTHPGGFVHHTTKGQWPATFPPVSSIHRTAGEGRDLRGCIRINLRLEENPGEPTDSYVLILRGQSPRTLSPTSDLVAGARQALTPDGLATLLATSYHRAEKVDVSHP